MRQTKFVKPSEIQLSQSLEKPLKQPLNKQDTVLTNGVPNFYRYYSKQQPQAFENLIFSVAKQLLDGKSEITIEYIDKQSIQILIDVLNLDFPELLPFTLQTYILQGEFIKTLVFQRPNKSDTQNYQKQIESIVESLIQPLLILTSDYDKFHHIFNLLTQFQCANSDNIEYNSILCLLSKKATPLGISKAFTYLSNKLNIFSIVNKAKIGNCIHYFNTIFQNNSFSNVDCYIPAQTLYTCISQSYFSFSDDCIQNMALAYNKPECLSNYYNPLFISGYTPSTALELGKIIAKSVDKQYIDIFLDPKGNKLEDILISGQWCSKRYTDAKINIMGLKFDELNIKHSIRLYISQGDNYYSFPYEISQINNNVIEELQQSFIKVFEQKYYGMFIIIDFHSDYESVKGKILSELGKIFQSIKKLGIYKDMDQINYSGNSSASVFLIKC
ncbi:Transglutaminase/protease-like domain-containing protein [Spironucleus salmonicida]|uniref:Transglutaminase/protease-like domain-containing protein n=1 Tax=Spironucleus salmonicida TaxID=348837 RepID=V6LMR6_9EUKA|nr:Transglutaminase/protease-like domain-containing protein [Spironucleus salmonicida]|eukprot:EST45006.1 Transglutaminase/protease-like domain-containing protein [Spironucleus salmonicida]